MSKSLDNGIDPLQVIEQYGCDTLRFMLITGNTPGNDMRFYWSRLEATRNFANKIWNASRFALMNLEGYQADAKRAPYELADKWILSRMQDVAEDVTSLLDRFELGEAGRAIYDFIWGEICDWYIEMAKPRLYGKSGGEARATAQQVLVTVLTGAMKLLHPYMPFITEEIYQALPPDCESIMISPCPMADPALQDKTVEKGMGAVMDAIKSIREMRAQVNANPGKKVPAILLVSDELQAVLTENASYIHQLANVDKLDLLPLDSSKPENAMASVNAGVEVYLPLKGLIDVEAETARLNKELAGLQKEMKRVSGKLQNQGFLAKAPKEVVEKEQAKADEFAAKIKAIEERLAYLKTI